MYQRQEQLPPGPMHPDPSKSVIMMITRSGLLRCLYQTADSRWTESFSEMHNTYCSDDRLTHASMSQMPNGLPFSQCKCFSLLFIWLLTYSSEYISRGDSCNERSYSRLYRHYLVGYNNKLFTARPKTSISCPTRCKRVYMQRISPAALIIVSITT